MTKLQTVSNEIPILNEKHITYFILNYPYNVNIYISFNERRRGTKHVKGHSQLIVRTFGLLKITKRNECHDVSPPQMKTGTQSYMYIK